MYSPAAGRQESEPNLEVEVLMLNFFCYVFKHQTDQTQSKKSEKIVNFC